ELFVYLLHHYGQIVQKAELIHLLWPDYDEQRAFSRLYTTIYHVRKTIHLFGGDHFSIKNVTEGYILTLDDVFVDIEEWECQLQVLPELNRQTADSYEAIMRLNTGPFLKGLDYLWAEAERFRLEQ